MTVIQLLDAAAARLDGSDRGDGGGDGGGGGKAGRE